MVTLTSSLQTLWVVTVLQLSSATARVLTSLTHLYSFAIMAAQVLSGRLVYDSSDSFDTSYGLCFHWSFTHTQGKAQKHCVCDWFVFSLGSCSLSSIATHTHSVCECSVPRTSTSCEWVFSRDESTGECVLGCQSVLSSLFVFFSPLFHLLTLLSCPLFHSSHSPLLHAHTPAFDVIVDTLSALH